MVALYLRALIAALLASCTIGIMPYDYMHVMLVDVGKPIKHVKLVGEPELAFAFAEYLLRLGKIARKNRWPSFYVYMTQAAMYEEKMHDLRRLADEIAKAAKSRLTLHTVKGKVIEEDLMNLAYDMMVYYVQLACSAQYLEAFAAMFERGTLEANQHTRLDADTLRSTKDELWKRKKEIKEATHKMLSPLSSTDRLSGSWPKSAHNGIDMLMTGSIGASVELDVTSQKTNLPDAIGGGASPAYIDRSSEFVCSN